MISIPRRLLNRIIQSVALDGIFPRSPFGSSPAAGPASYERLFEDWRHQSYPVADEIEKRMGYAIDRDWLATLAFNTQVTQKKSDPNWQHGRVIYAVVRRHIAERADFSSPFNIFETGTARGFSAVCAARALIDAGQVGAVVTLDTLPHEEAIFWNVASDNHRGPISRAALLDQWPTELERIIFLRGWSKRVLTKVGISRVHFAFLDAQHIFKEVVREYRWVRDRQFSGDQILFDDATPGKFDGVLREVGLAAESGPYRIEQIEMSPQRGLALASRE